MIRAWRNEGRCVCVCGGGGGSWNILTYLCMFSRFVKLGAQCPFIQRKSINIPLKQPMFIFACLYARRLYKLYRLYTGAARPKLIAHFVKLSFKGALSKLPVCDFTLFLNYFVIINTPTQGRI